MEGKPDLALERVELRDAVASHLREMILSGDVAPGDRLVETELATRFGTSRGPVRDALAELAKTGLVTIVNRRGSFVSDVALDDIDEVYSLRLALESLAVRRAVDDGDPDLGGRLADLVAEIDDALERDDRRAVGEADMAFHRAIVEAAHHQRLLDSWDGLADQTLLLMRVLTEVQPELQSAGGEHTGIVEGVRSGNADAAVQALADHLSSAREAVSHRFSQHLAR